MRGIWVVLSTLLALLVAGPAVAEEPVPDDVDALARTAGLPWLARQLADEGADPAATLGLRDAHAVHHFSQAWVDGVEGAEALGPVEGWVVPWTVDGLPGGVLRIVLVDGEPQIDGMAVDAHVAGALITWDGQGDLVEEPARGRWFALQDGTLTTLVSLASDLAEPEYPVADYPAEVTAASPPEPALLPASTGTAALTGLVALLLAGAVAVRLSRRPSRRERSAGTAALSAR